MIIAGLPYTFEGQSRIDGVTGCSPYGASTIAGGNGHRARTSWQGRHVASIAAKLIK
jgi:NAD(P)H dehydrogenase (quinone)